MRSMKSFRFHGGMMIVCCFFLIIVTTGISYNCWSVFTIPVCEDLSITRQQFNGLLTAYLLGSVCSSLHAAQVLARFGLVRVMRAGAVLLSLIVAASTLVQQAWHLYLVGFLSGYVYTATSFFTLSILISNWFIKKRGLVLGFVFMGSGLGSMVLIPLADSFILCFGWRIAMLILSAILATVSIPICFFGIWERPNDVGCLPYGADASEPIAAEMSKGAEVSMRQILGRPIFWMLAVFTAGTGVIAFSGMSIVPYLCDEGYSSAQAAAVQSLGMGFIAMSRILMGQLADRIGIVRILPVCILLTPLMPLGLIGLHIFPLAIWCIVIGFGVSQAVITVCMPLITDVFMGKRAYAKAYGIISAVNNLTGAVTPLLQGALYTQYGSYAASYRLFTGLFFVAAFCFLFTARIASKPRTLPS